MEVLDKKIDKKIAALSSEQETKYRQRLIDNLYGRFWCEMHEINYADPDINKAKEELYKEMIESGEIN